MLECANQGGARFRFQRTEAYERLRRYSRTARRKVVEIATEIVTATEELGKQMRAIESVAREPLDTSRSPGH